MAGADYYSCDVCGSKAFYDANLNYDFDKRDAHGNPKLDYVGAMACICDDCAKTHKIEVVAIAAPTDAKADELHNFIVQNRDSAMSMFEYRTTVKAMLSKSQAAQSVRDAAQPIADNDEQPHFYTFTRPTGWINLRNPGQSWEEWTKTQGIPTTRGWKVMGSPAIAPGKDSQ